MFEVDHIEFRGKKGAESLIAHTVTIITSICPLDKIRLGRHAPYRTQWIHIVHTHSETLTLDQGCSLCRKM